MKCLERVVEIGPKWDWDYSQACKRLDKKNKLKLDQNGIETTHSEDIEI